MPFVGDYLHAGHELIDPPLVTETDKDIKPELALLVHRMLAKDLAERPTRAKGQIGTPPSYFGSLVT